MAMKSVDSTTRFPHGARHSRMVTPWVLEFVNSPQRLRRPAHRLSARRNSPQRRVAHRPATCKAVHFLLGYTGTM